MLHPSGKRTTEYRARAGFTMAEVMLALGILVLLLALLIPNLAGLRRSLRQKELDAKAEILYMAAQNQLIKLRAAGNTQAYAAAGAVPGQPSDAVGMDAEGQPIVRVLSFAGQGDAAGRAILPPDGADSELLAHTWVVEYDPASAGVYAVYYGEERDVSAGYRADWARYDSLRDRDARLKDGAKVGYYGGDVSSSGGGTSQLKPTIDVRNGERLTAFLQCTAPKSTDELVFHLTITDAYGHSCRADYARNTIPQVRQAGRSFYVELTLDDLGRAETRFDALYGPSSGRPAAEQLTPGSSLTLTLTVGSRSGLIETSAPVSAVTNSLFGDGSGAEAYIACGRHLQNLDASSGVTGAVTAAAQTQDVDFDDTAAELWLDSYGIGYFNGLWDGSPRFRPISNGALKRFDGAGHRIAGLRAADGGSAGLFAALDGGVTLTGVRLTGARVRGASAGALAGFVSGADNRIEDCRVYLERGDFLGRDDRYIWIEGERYAGGLVGMTGGGALTVRDSFASTVVSAGADGRAGGLLGLAADGVFTARRCYADCYLTGRDTGGLVGGGGGVRLEDCYAAGFQTGQTAAGLVNGGLESARRCYTICALDGTEGAVTYSTARTAAPGGLDAVRWFSGSNDPAHDLGATASIGSMTGAQLQSLLGSAFRTDTGDTVAYNLRRQGLTAYPYPRLDGSRHYGDWQAEFQTGALVYYEKYLGADRDWGFHGGNLSTLTDAGTVAGDGYGVVFRRGGDSAIPGSVRVRLNGGGWQTLSASAGFDATDPETGCVYFIIPLPKDLLNAAPPEAAFYRTAEVSTGTGEPLPFYFNPHFAKTAVPDMGDLPPVEEISVRTPRHLDHLSRYYDEFYAAPTLECVFRQERSISFSRYDWPGFTDHGQTVSTQTPIGVSIHSPFRAEYNGGGYTITDVSFVTDAGDCVGMFGFNAGVLRNIVLATEYDPDAADHFYVRRRQNMRPNEPVYMGVLAGCNSEVGTVTNCAVAGYYLAGSDGTLHAYENCTLYAGGLLGSNAGQVRSCSADCPGMRLSSVFATVDVGGLVGLNESAGSLSDCYALGHIEVVDTRGGQVRVAGFAGRNDGRISKSYCAVSLVTSGMAAASGFAPRGGLVTDCLYLDRGTYTYVDQLRAYNSSADATSGSPATYAQLQAGRGSAAVTRAGSLCHPNTPGGSAGAYPFRAVVKDRFGAWVHYGDWQTPPRMGTLGVFYWEREEGGSNAGYHFTYLGTAEGSADSGTSLCTAHDDGGVIGEFGYGYYVQRGQEDAVHLTSDGIAVGHGCNTAAKAALEEQISGFTFYPYTTRVAASGQYVCLDNGRSGTGRWTLTYRDYSYTYEIAPFFANAMRRVDAGGSVMLTASDWRRTDYSQAPGSPDNPFEVRSLQQLRSINWNCETRSCDTLVYGLENQPEQGNYRDFPYLQYATVLTRGIQERQDVEALRPPRDWVQSHDILGAGETVTPIAGMATSSPVSAGNYRNFLFAWFGGSYDGQSYKIQNVNVISEAYSVGLFGATAGASIRNVILFADDGRSRISRETEGKTAVSVAGRTLNFEKGPGAYFLGGLVGIAYEYNTGEITNKIENCAIAGYRVVDRSTNQQGAGTANVGGLIGLANVNLENCSSVAEIVLDCTHDNGHMTWGSYMRVGGLAGSAGAPGATVSVRNCYTGGSIRVTERTLRETPPMDNQGYAIRDAGGVGRSNNIFISGVIGGSYAPNVSNFTAMESNAPDGTANIVNCYTYLKLPDLEGTIRAVSYMANQGDRYGRNSRINVTNCYHLAEVNRDITYEKPPAYFFQVNKSRHVITDAEFAAMLDGDLTCLSTILNAQGASQKLNPARAVTFEELSDPAMAAALGTQWDWVTVTEGDGAAIDGKYSFSSDPGQEGKNYPFPTVLRQKDLTFSTADTPVHVNVHYGQWPTNGYAWANGRDTMDLFADAPADGLASLPDGPWAEKTFRLSYADASEFFGPTLDFDEDPDGRWELVGYTHNEQEKYFDVTIRARKPGSAVIREKISGASFAVNITARLAVTAETEELQLYHGTPRTVSFTARAALPEGAEPDGRADYTHAVRGTWSFESDETLIETEQPGDDPSVRTVTGHEPGRHVLTVTYTYDYHGVPVEQTLYLPVRTLGYVGLSNGEEHVSARRSDAVGPTEGESGAFGGTPTRPQGADVFLFATAADGDLAEFTVNRITVTEQPGGRAYTVYDAAPGAMVDTGRYSVRLLTDGEAPDVRTDGAFACLGAAVRDLGRPDQATPVEVTLELTDPGSAGRYRFTVPLQRVPDTAVRFDAGGGRGLMQEEGITDGTYTVPDCAFTRTGHTFRAWELDGGEVQPGQELTGLTGTVVLTALWEPNLYVVHFEPNGGLGERMEDLVLTYGLAPQPLPANAYRPPEPGQSFAGWSAEIGGERRVFADGEPVADLTTDTEITLTAEWQDTGLTLVGNGLSASYLPETGDTALAGYVAPEKADWLLEGWYTQPSGDGQRVLDALGAVAADVPGFTADGGFAMDGAQTLYARWIWHNNRVKEPDFAPNRQKWEEIWPIDLAAGEYLEAVLDLSRCATNKSNVFAFGETDITSWKTNLNTIQFYYPHSGAGRLLIREMRAQGYTALVLSDPILTLRLTAEGLWVNGQLLEWDNANYRNIIRHMVDQGPMQMHLGSMEGSNRDVVVYRTVRAGREDAYG